MFKAKCPYAQRGNLAVIFQGKEISLTVEDSLVEFGDDKGGKALLDYLVNYEKWTDLTKYPPGPVTHKSVDTSNFWELKMQNADDSKRKDGCIGMFVNGKERQIPVVQNIVATREKEVRDELLRSGWVLIRARTIEGLAPEFSISSFSQPVVKKSRVEEEFLEDMIKSRANSFMVTQE